jgi:hypothetical protein
MSSNEAIWLKEELLRVFDSVSRREFNQNPDLGLASRNFEEHLPCSKSNLG